MFHPIVHTFGLDNNKLALRIMHKNNVLLNNAFSAYLPNLFFWIQENKTIKVKIKVLKKSKS